MACAIDWFPTFGEIVGFESAEALDGRSILALLQGKPQSQPRTLVWKTGTHDLLGRKSWAAVRDGDWKWVSEPGEDGRLFDLQNDPYESTNRATEKPQLTRRMAALAE